MAVLAARSPFSEPSTATSIFLIPTDISGPGWGARGASATGSADMTTVLGVLMSEATTIPMPESTAAPRKAYRNPSTVADAGLTDAPREAGTTPTMVTAIARPMGPPTWVEVLMSPDARPSSPFLAPLSAAMLNAVKLVAA